MNSATIQSKLASIQGYFEELSPILDYSVQDIIRDQLKLRTVERLFQLIVDTAIDINTHIIAESNLAVPDDYQSTFQMLAEHGMIPHDFADRIAPSVGLRNMIVHRYGHVDIKRMIDDIKKEIGDYREYSRHILDLLEKE